jgi:hypothetical protein
LHLADDLKRNGVCQNTTSGPGEHRHISTCKRPGKNTQRIAETFEPQVGKNYIDNLKIDKAIKEIRVETNSIAHQRNIFSGKRYFIHDNILYDYKRKIGKKTFEQADEWFDTTLMNNVLNFVERFQSFNPNVGSLIFYTECRHTILCCDNITFQTYLIRANPMYKNKRCWHDWWYCDFDNIGIIPVKVIMFIEFDGQEITFQNEGCAISINEPGTYALCQKAIQPLDSVPEYRYRKFGGSFKAHTQSLLWYWTELQEEVLILPLKKLQSPCISVPNREHDEKKYPNSYLVMKNRDCWVSILIEEMRKEYDPDAKFARLQRRRQEKEANQRKAKQQRNKQTTKRRKQGSAKTLNTSNFQEESILSSG